MISISSHVKGIELAITGRQEWRHVPAVLDGYKPQQSHPSYRHCDRRLTSSCSHSTKMADALRRAGNVRLGRIDKLKKGSGRNQIHKYTENLKGKTRFK
jgi:hypothetical protein